MGEYEMTNTTSCANAPLRHSDRGRLPTKSKYEAILVAGYGHTGSSVVMDMLKECDGFHCPDLEFYIAQHPDGVIALEDALVTSWSDFNPDWAIRRFIKLIDILTRRGTRFRFGLDYNLLLCPEFKAISNNYIARLVDFKHSGHFYFRRADMNALTYLIFGMVRFIVQKFNTKFGKLIKDPSVFNTIVACPKDTFLTITRDYFEELFRAAAPDEKINKIVLDQGTTAYQPERIMNYFYSAKTIIVDRDPRDIYVSSLTSTFLPRDVNDFIRWQKMTREMSVEATADSDRVLRINFEEMIFDYQESCSRIFSFLKCDESIHVSKRKYFKPQISAKRTGKWKSYPLQSEISLIEKELSKYLYDSTNKVAV